MTDVARTSIVLIAVTASDIEGAWLTTNSSDFVYGGKTYVAVPSIEVEAVHNMGGGNTGDQIIKSVPASPGFLTAISNHMPYSRVAVKIIELQVADNGSYETFTIFNGLLCQVEVSHSSGFLKLICKDRRYYIDMTVGIPCTEQCAALWFGDKLCKKVVYHETVFVEAVSGVTLTLNAPPSVTTPLLFNKGYMEKGEVRIKIKYHHSGNSFQMDRYPPSSWVGMSVVLYAGCDRRLETCRNIHKNEARFAGLGYSMIDYNPMYENP